MKKHLLPFFCGAALLLLIGASVSGNSIFRFQEWRLSTPSAGQVVAFHDAGTLTNVASAAGASARRLFIDATNRASGVGAIASWTVPANTLDDNGDSLVVTMTGVNDAVTPGVHAFIIKWDGITIYTSGADTLPLKDWWFQCTIARYDSVTMVSGTSVNYPHEYTGWVPAFAGTITTAFDANKVISVVGNCSDSGSGLPAVENWLFTVDLYPRP